MNQFIEFQDVSKRFGSEVVLDGFSRRFPLGEASCIMGRSGVGKTTIFRLILGLIRPDSGIIQIPNGIKTAAVFQENRLIRHMSALENVFLVVEDSAVQRIRAEELLSRMGFDAALFEKRIDELSGGQQRRVAIARALIADADVILMDEPLKGLDTKTVEVVCGVINGETRGRTLIFSTHDRNEAERLNAEIFEI